MKNDIVTQYGSFAHGAYTTASGQASHAEGVGTVANHLAQNVSGMYNIPDPASTTDDQRGTYIEIVGNGTASTLSNARTLDWEGNEKISGNLTINAGSTSEITITPELLNNAGGSNSGEGSTLKYVKDVQGYEQEFLIGFNPDITENDFDENGQIIHKGYQVTNLTESDFNTLFNTLLLNNAGDDGFLAYLTFGGIDTYRIIYCHEHDSNRYIQINNSLSLWIEEGKVLVSDFWFVSGYIDSIKQALEQNSDLNEVTTINIYKFYKISDEEDPLHAVVENDLENIASGYYSHAEGIQTVASVDFSHAEGGGTIASAEYSHAEGRKTAASGYTSHAEGNNTIASGEASHAEGTQTTASANYSHAEGYRTTASEGASHAEGQQTTASGEASHTEGGYTTASGNASHAEGGYTIASGDGSHAEGAGTTASGQSAHAEGEGTKALGQYSHAEGHFTEATSDGAHAEGWGCKALHNMAHAEGSDTKAEGPCSHAEGGRTTASGGYSHAEGSRTIANHEFQHVFGTYNVADTSTAPSTERGTYIEIVGNGTSALTGGHITESYSNARTLDWAGNEQIAGSLTLGMGTTAQVTITPQRLRELLALLLPQENQ